MRREWVGEIRFSAAVEMKLRAKHGLTPDEVRTAVSVGAHDRARWDDDPRRGRRLIIFGRDERGTIVAYLRPIDRRDGVWQCVTAWRV